MGTLRLLNLLQKPLSLNTRRNLDHHDDVDKLGKSASNRKTVVVREINNPGVGGLVTHQPAGLEKRRDIRRQAQAFYPLVKAFPGSSEVADQLLQAKP